MSEPWTIITNPPMPYAEICPDGSVNVYRRDGSLALSLTEDNWVALVEGLVMAGRAAAAGKGET